MNGSHYKILHHRTILKKEKSLASFLDIFTHTISSEAPLYSIYPTTVTGLRYPEGISINDSKCTILALKGSSLKHLFLFLPNYEYEK